MLASPALTQTITRRSLRILIEHHLRIPARRRLLWPRSWEYRARGCLRLSRACPAVIAAGARSHSISVSNRHLTRIFSGGPHDAETRSTSQRQEVCGVRSTCRRNSSAETKSGANAFGAGRTGCGSRRTGCGAIIAPGPSSEVSGCCARQSACRRQ